MQAISHDIESGLPIQPTENTPIKTVQYQGRKINVLKSSANEEQSNENRLGKMILIILSVVSICLLAAGSFMINNHTLVTKYEGIALGCFVTGLFGTILFPPYLCKMITDGFCKSD